MRGFLVLGMAGAAVLGSVVGAGVMRATAPTVKAVDRAKEHEQMDLLRLRLDTLNTIVEDQAKSNAHLFGLLNDDGVFGQHWWCSTDGDFCYRSRAICEEQNKGPCVAHRRAFCSSTSTIAHSNGFCGATLDRCRMNETIGGKPAKDRDPTNCIGVE
jgi:hypothetical protein